MRVGMFLLLLICPSIARADLVHHIVNGNFNDGMNGWTVSNWTTSTTPPDLGHGVYAIAQGAGTVASMWQEFLIPLGTNFAEFSWRDAFNSGGINWADGAHEFYVTLSNAGGVNPIEVFSTASSPSTQISGTNQKVLDVSAFATSNAGQTVRVSFNATLSAGSTPPVFAKVDTVEFATAAVPEPSSLLLTGIPMAVVAIRRRRSRRSAAATT